VRDDADAILDVVGRQDAVVDLGKDGAGEVDGSIGVALDEGFGAGRQVHQG
jgi:hypothetical protein